MMMRINENDDDDDDDDDEVVGREAMIVRGVHENWSPPPLLSRKNERIPLVWRAKLLEEESWEIQLLEIRLDTD